MFEKMSTSVKYYDSCPECDSLNVKICGEEHDGENKYLTLVCKDCGADWVDINE